jgi:hypothetical protein
MLNHHAGNAEHLQGDMSLNRSTFQATAHWLTGCAIGEVLGMIIATALGWGNAASIGISVALAFPFGYSLTLGPVLRANVPFRSAAGLANRRAATPRPSRLSCRRGSRACP